MSKIINERPVNSSERYLESLCNKTFLSLWSHPRIFRDQGNKNGREGKEICDLLVIFKNNVIIFSDKNCIFPQTNDIKNDWSRWFRRAIKDSANQIWGAERWIKNFPNRLFIDKKCKIKLPFDLSNSNIKFHLIVVAHGASERCKTELGGSGSLIIHSGVSNIPDKPFNLGVIDKGKSFIHYLDDISLDVLLKELDTAPDFIEYLEKKERMFQSKNFIVAAGEEEMLAYYLMHIGENKKNDFILPAESNNIYFNRGIWQGFQNHPQRIKQLEENKISYLWDDLIEKFTYYNIKSIKEGIILSDIEVTEKIMAFLTGEPRFHRRVLARQVKDVFFDEARCDNPRYIILDKENCENCYIFLPFRKTNKCKYEEYRKLRIIMLEHYCMIAKLRTPSLKNIIGITMDPISPNNKSFSQDAMYFDASVWTKDDQDRAEKIKKEFGLGEARFNFSKEKNYPDI